jgi:hypothetical protein
MATADTAAVEDAMTDRAALALLILCKVRAA